MTDILIISIGMAIFLLVACVYISVTKLHNDITEVKNVLINQFAVISSMKLQRDFEQIERMKAILAELVEREAYEDAGRMQKSIDERTEAANNEVRRFNEMFSGIAEFNVCRISTNGQHD